MAHGHAGDCVTAEPGCQMDFDVDSSVQLLQTSHRTERRGSVQESHQRSQPFPAPNICPQSPPASVTEWDEFVNNETLHMYLLAGTDQIQIGNPGGENLAAERNFREKWALPNVCMSIWQVSDAPNAAWEMRNYPYFDGPQAFSPQETEARCKQMNPAGTCYTNYWHVGEHDGGRLLLTFVCQPSYVGIEVFWTAGATQTGAAYSPELKKYVHDLIIKQGLEEYMPIPANNDPSNDLCPWNITCAHCFSA